MLDFFRNISTTELIIIVAILMLLFGAKLMMKVARTSGETVREMKKIKKEFSDAIIDDKKPSK